LLLTDINPRGLRRRRATRWPKATSAEAPQEFSQEELIRGSRKVMGTLHGHLPCHSALRLVNTFFAKSPSENNKCGLKKIKNSSTIPVSWLKGLPGSRFTKGPIFWPVHRKAGNAVNTTPFSRPKGCRVHNSPSCKKLLVGASSVHLGFLCGWV